MTISLEIRQALDNDLSQINQVHEKAFGLEQSQEILRLINDLLHDPTAVPYLSLVAVQKYQVVGHILFTPVKIISTEQTVSASILAPLAVIPDAQNQGIGGQLIQAGIRLLENQGIPLVFVLGYPKYYTRYGFVPAFPYGFITPYPIPDEQSDAWMVNILDPLAAEKYAGNIHCADALHHPEYWSK